MSQYVIGETGKRKLNSLFQQSLESNKRTQFTASHAIDNVYPHPYEMRWTESQISGGGYMMWLPPDCLHVNGYNIPVSGWVALNGQPLEGCRIDSDLSSGNWWYDMSKALNIEDSPSCDIYMNASVQGEVAITKQANPTLLMLPGFIHITTVENYRSKPNVKSALQLTVKKSPFDLRRMPSDRPLFKEWIMTY